MAEEYLSHRQRHHLSNVMAKWQKVADSSAKLHQAAQEAAAEHLSKAQAEREAWLQKMAAEGKG